MRVTSIRDIGNIPSTGALMGCATNQNILNQINQNWGGSGSVIFGNAMNHLTNKFASFMNVVSNVNNGTAHMIQFISDYITSGDVIKAVTHEDHLPYVPECMKIPILHYAPIKELVGNGMIHGWGHTIDDLAGEDVCGRLINNGTALMHHTFEGEQFLTWEWKSTDPNYTFDELDMLDESRQWIDSFMQAQMSKDGEMLDPTAWDTGGTIGKLVE